MAEGTITFIPTTKPAPIVLVSAAVRVKTTGEIFPAKFHDTAGHLAEAKGYKWDEYEEGYITEKGDFIEYGETRKMMAKDCYSVVCNRFSKNGGVPSDGN